MTPCGWQGDEGKSGLVMSSTGGPGSVIVVTIVQREGYNDSSVSRAERPARRWPALFIVGKKKWLNQYSTQDLSRTHAKPSDRNKFAFSNFLTSDSSDSLV